MKIETIISYRFFKTTEEFEKWQEEKERKIITVQPLPYKLDIEEGDKKAKADITVGVNVTFWKSID